MASVVSNQTLITQIQEGHALFGKEACKSATMTYLTGTVVIGSLFVITCASFCLSIHGVRLMEDIVYPAYVPAGAALLVSIPFIVASVKLSNAHHKVYKERIMDKARRVLDSQELIDLAAKEKTRSEAEKAEYKDKKLTDKQKDEKARIKNYTAHYMIENLVPLRSSKMYKQKFFSDLKALVPGEEKDQTEEQKAFIQACDDALQIVMKRPIQMPKPLDQIKEFAAKGECVDRTATPNIQTLIINSTLVKDKEYYDDASYFWRYTLASANHQIEVALKYNKIEVLKVSNAT